MIYRWFQKIPHPLFLIMVGALFVRLVIAGCIYFELGSKGLFFSDSYGFHQTATNILDGHGFSREATAPFVPSAHFPPVYPLLIAGSLFVSGSILPLILLQILLASSLPLIVWKIAERLTNRKPILYTAAALAAFEPLGILWSITLLTDLPSVFFFLLSALFFLRVLDTKTIRDAALSGLTLGLAALTRPESQYIFIVTVLGLGVAALFKKLPWKIVVYFALLFLIVFSPWMIRNIVQFGSPNGSTTGLRNVYSSLATSVVTYKTGRPFHEVKKELNEGIARKYGFDVKDITENPKIGPILAKEGTKILVENPKETITTVAITEISFFTQDLYTTYLHHFKVTRDFPIEFSPSVVLFREGPVVLFSKIWSAMGGLIVIPILGRLLWVLLTLLGLAGFCFAVTRAGQIRRNAIILALIIAIYAGGSLVAGFSDHGRHRFRVNHFIFILASYGAVETMRTLALWRTRKQVGL